MLDNWRMSHAFPLNTCQVLLRRRAIAVDPDAEVVQRLKRRTSVYRKLRLKPDMGLERMQDIAGCRAVVTSVEQVYAVLNALFQGASRHNLREPFDYVQNPKPDGYRSVHLVVQYQSTRNTTYNKHLVEMQIRTRLQHAWSTAVETVGTFLGFNLKGGEGPPEWLEFFRLVSCEFAAAEGTPRVAGTPPENDCLRRIGHLADQLAVVERLLAFRDALKVTENEEGGVGGLHYYLLQLSPVAPDAEEPGPTLRITAYSRRELDHANEEYSRLEQQARVEGREWDVVLVSASSLEALRNAYSNYFANTRLFLDRLRVILARADFLD